MYIYIHRLLHFSSELSVNSTVVQFGSYIFLYVHFRYWWAQDLLHWDPYWVRMQGLTPAVQWYCNIGCPQRRFCCLYYSFFFHLSHHPFSGCGICTVVHVEWYLDGEGVMQNPIRPDHLHLSSDKTNTSRTSSTDLFSHGGLNMLIFNYLVLVVWCLDGCLTAFRFLIWTLVGLFFHEACMGFIWVLQPPKTCMVGWL